MDRVLDKGYIRAIRPEHWGGDLSVVNSARVSYNKEVAHLGDGDKRLIRFLAREGHTSPFRHASLTFEIYAPLMVARQWWKHHVSSTHTEEQDGWNESSRRYITEEPEFYIPNAYEWRGKPENSKQGSGDNLGALIGKDLTQRLDAYTRQGEKLYNYAMNLGVAPEQARAFLPANIIYVRWYWHVSLQSAIHFLQLRVPSDAQKEIQDYARVVERHVKEHFPESYQAFMEER